MGNLFFLWTFSFSSERRGGIFISKEMGLVGACERPTHTSALQKEGRQVKESRTLVSYAAVSPVHPRGCDQKLSPARKGNGQRRKGSPAPSTSGTGARFQPSTLPAWPTSAIPDPSLPPWATWRYKCAQSALGKLPVGGATSMGTPESLFSVLRTSTVSEQVGPGQQPLGLIHCPTATRPIRSRC